MPPRPEVIRSRANPVVRRLRATKERIVAAGPVFLEGTKLIEEALRARVTIEEAAVSTRLAAGRARALVAELEAAGTRVHRLEESLLASLSAMETSPGILALARRPHFEEDELFHASALIVVAAGIQDPGNLGGLLRTAEAAGATGAYLTEGTADPFSWKALRGSMGSAFRLPHRRSIPLAAVLDALDSRGIPAVATVARDGQAYHQMDLRGPLALLFGSEGAGLPEEAIRRCKLRVTIPLEGAVESLNVGVAAGVILFEVARQRRR